MTDAVCVSCKMHSQKWLDEGRINVRNSFQSIHKVLAAILIIEFCSQGSFDVLIVWHYEIIGFEKYEHKHIYDQREES